MPFCVVSESGTLEEASEGSLVPGAVYTVSATAAPPNLSHPIELRIRLSIVHGHNFGLFKSRIKTYPRYAA